MSAYTIFAKRVYYPLLDLNKRSRFSASLADAERNQFRDRTALERLQLHKLQAIIAHAQSTCRFYADRFRHHGVTAATLGSLADIRRFPLLTKEDLFEHRQGLLSSAPEGKLFAASTSGSTGITTRFHLDSAQYAWAEACQWRGRRWWRVDRGDRQLVLWSRPVDASRLTQFQAWAKYRLRNYLQFNTFLDFDGARVDAVIAAIRRFRPRLIYGYGSSIARVAERLRERGEVLQGAERPRLVEYTADHMYEREQETALQVFAAPVTSAYGASECGGVAQQCPQGNLHVSVDHALVEFLRPDASAADPEETAEIVLTTLNNHGMPLIRYRIGDLGSYSGKSCACGVTLPLMQLQIGKAVDLVSTSTKQAVSAHLFDYINIHLMKQNIRGIKQFFVEQTGRDQFVLSIVPESPFEQRAADVFVDRMKAHLGGQIEVTTRLVESIALQPSGKRRYFKKTFTE